MCSTSRVFEKIVRYCEKYGNLIPVSFVLGFYVSIVVGRWWDQYKSIPWPDSIAVFVSANIQGQVRNNTAAPGLIYCNHKRLHNKNGFICSLRS